jgi:hypothetical protein
MVRIKRGRRRAERGWPVENTEENEIVTEIRVDNKVK